MEAAEQRDEREGARDRRRGRRSLQRRFLALARVHGLSRFEPPLQVLSPHLSEYTAEARASQSSAKRELERVGAGIKKVIEAAKAGFAGPELKAEMDTLQSKNEAMRAQPAAADATPPFLLPNLADLWRRENTEQAGGPDRRPLRLRRATGCLENGPKRGS